MRFNATEVHEAGRQAEEETGDDDEVGRGVIETLAGCLEHVGRMRFQRNVADNCGRSHDAPSGIRAFRLAVVAKSCHPEAAAKLMIFAY